MKFFIIIASLCFLLTVHSFPLNGLMSFNEESSNSTTHSILSNGIREHLLNSIKEINRTYDRTNNSLAMACVDVFESIFNDTNSKKYKFYMNKLIQDSSKGVNELSTYANCKKRKYGFEEEEFKGDNITYYLVTIVDKTHNLQLTGTDYEENWNMFGICLPPCLNYSLLVNTTLYEFLELEKGYNLTEKNYTDDKGEIIKYNVTNCPIEDVVYFYREHKNSPIEIGVFVIILLLVIVQMLWIVFNCVPFFLFKSCFKRNDNDDTAISYGKSKGEQSSESNPDIPKRYNRHEFKQFKISFSLSQNWDLLFNQNTGLTNYSGLTYIKGLRGFSIIFYCFGVVLYVLYNSPVSIYVENTFIEMLRSFLFSIFYIGLRYSPRILLSCSGYCLVYKLFSYLDENSLDEMDRRLKRKRRKKTKKMNGEYVDDYDDEDEEEEEEDDDNKEKDKDKKEEEKKPEQDVNSTLANTDLPRVSDIKFSFLWRFYFYQIHKYIIYLFLLIAIYSLVILSEKGPIFDYFREYIIKFKFVPFLRAVFCFESILDHSSERDERELFIIYFWLIYCEFIFFLFTTFIIFLGYKYRFNFQQLFYTIIIITILGKIGVGIYGITSGINTIKATFFYHINSSFWLQHPMMNYMYYLIGFIFGSANYVFQKRLDYPDILKLEKPYLDSIVSLVNWFKNKTKKYIYVLSFIIVLVFLAFSFSEILILYYEDINDNEGIGGFTKSKQKHLKNFLDNPYNNFYMMLDTEIIVVIIHLMAFGFYVKGENFINNMFSNSMWFIFDKLYFSFALLINPLTLYILSQCETRILLNKNNAIMYSFICGFISFIGSIIVFIFFEVPYKRIIKLISKSYLKPPEEEDEDNYQIVLGKDEI